MKEAFIQNDEYIEMLRQNSLLSKKPNFSNTIEYKTLQRELLQMELKLTSNEILQNTKIAFPHPSE